MNLSEENKNWLEEFKQKNGRAPSILHVGNIANNAYNNAKLLNDAGFDCDVICYDYYHIMGCPEWEDADFEGDIKDQFYPAWENVDLRGFKRTEWFVQGPCLLCIAYLQARRKGRTLKAKYLWWKLRLAAKIYCAIKRHGNNSLYFKLISFKKQLIDRHKSRRTNIIKIWKESWSQGNCTQDASEGNNIQPRKKLNLKEFFQYTWLIASYAALLGPLLILFLMKKGYRKILPIRQDNKFSETLNLLLKEFQEAFPDRPDKLEEIDIEPLRYRSTSWRKLFDCYDIIQAYSTDPILPLVAGKRPYTAFEHGTLRDIPFMNDACGRRTALSYHLADWTFVTNSDCIENAKKLAGDKVTFINHPYDEDHANIDVEKINKFREDLEKELNADFLFFFPTRQDWVPGTGFADKGNDIFFTAFAALRKAGYKVGMVCCEWGKNIAESKGFLAEKSVSQNVRWVLPLGTVAFEKYVFACDIVADQFKLGAFGGILFKSMSVGAAVCSYLNEPEIEKQYGEMLPIINCRTSAEIEEKIKLLIEGRDKIQEYRDESRKWIKRHYASAETVANQINCYKDLMNNGK